MNETIGGAGMGPEEPVVSSRSGHRNRNVLMLGGLALVLVAGVALAGVFPTGDRAGTTTTDTCAQGGGCSVGDVGPGGGLVFYDAGSEQDWGQYIEMAPKAWNGGGADPTAEWCNPTVNVTGTGKRIGWGLRNTQAIAQACTDSAAKMAQDYGGGSLSDWFLPSRGELEVLSNYVQGSSLSSAYAFDNAYYWSSTPEMNTSQAARSEYVNDGQDYAKSTWEVLSVRPVRAF